MERRELVKKLLALAAIPAVAKVFPEGTALARALDVPQTLKKKKHKKKKKNS